MPIDTLPPALAPGVLFHEDVRLKINQNITQINANVANISTNGDRLTVLEQGLQGLDDGPVVTLKEPEDFNITFASDKLYVVEGHIDLTAVSYNIDVPIGGLNIQGYGIRQSSITSSRPNYKLFTGATSGTLEHGELSISITGTGSQVYDLTAAAPADVVLGRSIFYLDCTSRGELSGFATALFQTMQLTGGTPYLTLSGTWIAGIGIENASYFGLDDFAGAMYRAGTAFAAPTFTMKVGLDLPASASLLDFAPANITTSSGLLITGSIVTRGGIIDPSDANLTPNTSADDLTSSWRNNRGLNETNEGGSEEVTVEVANAYGAANQFQRVAGTWTPSDLVHFDAPSANELRHCGDTPLSFTVFFNAEVDGPPGINVIVELRKYNSDTTNETLLHSYTKEIFNLQGGTDVAFFNIVHPVQLSRNESVRLYMANGTDAANLTMRVSSSLTIT